MLSVKAIINRLLRRRARQAVFGLEKAFAAWHSLCHGIRRATFLYTREALVLRKIADRTIHRKVY